MPIFTNVSGAKRMSVGRDSKTKASINLLGGVLSGSLAGMALAQNLTLAAGVTLVLFPSLMDPVALKLARLAKLPDTRVVVGF